MTDESPDDGEQPRRSTPPTARAVDGADAGVDRGTGLLPDGGQQEAEEDDEAQDGEEADEGEQESEEDEAEEEAAGEEEEEQHEESGGEGTQVLYLDLEGLFLNLLGLEVDLDEVELDVSAVPGEGRLLGNLLSAVGGLIDSPTDILSGALDDVLGGLTGSEEGEADEDGESPVSDAAGSAKSALSDAADEVPVDELMSQIAAEMVRQLLGSSEDEQSGESGEAAEASG